MTLKKSYRGKKIMTTISQPNEKISTWKLVGQ